MKEFPNQHVFPAPHMAPRKEEAAANIPKWRPEAAKPQTLL